MEQFLRRHWNDPVHLHVHRHYLTLCCSDTIGQARAKILGSTLKRNGTQTVYYYVIDENGRLVGILGIEALALASDDELVSGVMNKDVYSLGADETTESALRMLMLSMLRAVPVTDKEGVLVGVIAYEQIREAVTAMNANPGNATVSRETMQRDLENLLGFRNDEEQRAGVVGAFKIRAPWLVVTICAGVICTLAIDRYSVLLKHFAFVVGAIPIALGLADAVCHQASSIAILQHIGELRKLRRLRKAFMKELLTALAIGIAAGVVICLLSLGRQEGAWPSFVIAVAITLSIICGGVYGHVVPVVIRLLSHNPHVSGGPIALALTDLTATLILLEVSRCLLG